MFDINQRVKKMRKKHFFTQDRFATNLGIKTSTYSQMERSGNISAETLKKIAKLLDIDIRYFLYGEEFLDIQEETKSIEPPTPPNVYELLDIDEKNILITYRNLNSKEKQQAYHLFMENFNINVIRIKKQEKKRKNRKLRENNKTNSNIKQ